MLLAYVVFFFACFEVRDLCRSGCRQNYNLTPIHGPWSRITKTSHLNLKREVSRTGKKGLRLRLCFRVVVDVPEKKGMDLWKQMSSIKCSFTCICGISLALNPSTTTVYARSAFYPSLRFTLSLQSAFYPWSAVCSLQSAVCSLQSAVCLLHWPILVSFG